jgi:general transcription factor IIIA
MSLTLPSSFASTSVLGKRKAESKHLHNLVLHVVSSESEYEETEGVATPTLNGEGSESVVLKRKRPYACTYSGCNKAYSKPSRLKEHERSHTGEVSSLSLNRSLCCIITLLLIC